MDIQYIVIHHSLTPRDLYIWKSVRSFDRSHKARLHTLPNSLGYHIAYHYIIAGNGSTVQTRGLQEPGRHASNRYVNTHSIGICCTGNFDEEKPTEQQYEKVRELIRNIKKNRPNAKVVGHKEFANKTCPGKNFIFEKILMGFYRELREKHVKDKIPKEERTFKSPDGFADRVKGMSTEEKMEELVYLMGFLLEIQKGNVK